ncbi:thermonuclease family protein [Sulfurimonas sp.]|nr:thermonuclease family protein [Sulfurimonas sp.]
MSIIVNGIDAPEIKGKYELEKVLALKAKKQTVFMLRGAKVIELRNMKRGKYFRIVADVFVDDVNLS